MKKHFLKEDTTPGIKRWYCVHTEWVREQLSHIKINASAPDDYLIWDVGDTELYGFHQDSIDLVTPDKQLLESEFVELVKRHFPKKEAKPSTELPVSTECSPELLERLEQETEVKWIGNKPNRPTDWNPSKGELIVFGIYEALTLSLGTDGQKVPNDEFVEIVKSKLPKVKPAVEPYELLKLHYDFSRDETNFAPPASLRIYDRRLLLS